MKMSGRVIICCGALFLSLTSVSAVQRLNLIHDLKKINSAPQLVLLYWFANTVDININSNIQLTFDPNDRDYGSHYYSNYERLLDPPPHGHRYYTVGNLNQHSPMELPSYVVNNRMVYMGRNKARIIISVRGPNPGRQAQWIDRVYITQHYETSGYGGTGEYDPQHTYEISTNLLREISEFSGGDDQWLLRHLRDQYAGNTNDLQLNDIRNTWGNLAGLGLLFIVIQKGYYFNQANYRLQSRQNDRNANAFVCCFVLVFLVVLILIVLSVLSHTNSR